MKDQRSFTGSEDAPTWRQSDEAIRNLIAAEIWAYQECVDNFGPLDQVSADGGDMKALAKNMAVDEAERIRKVVLESPVVRARILGAAQGSQEPRKLGLSFCQAMDIAEDGLRRWRDKDHNAKWWRKIDGTPIPNDLLVNIAESMIEAYVSITPQPASNAYAGRKWDQGEHEGCGIDSQRAYDHEVIAEWIAYADKLENALKIAAGLTDDGLKRMQIEDGLRLVRPSVSSTPSATPADLSDCGDPNCGCTVGLTCPRSSTDREPEK